MPLTPQTQPRIQWEHAVLACIEDEEGICTSDAQAIIEADPARLDGLFSAGAAPADAAAAFLMA